MRDRLDWLTELGRLDGIEEERLAAGCLSALAALETLAAGGPLTTEVRGPVFEGHGVATVERVARLRWHGFRTGWDEPADQRQHPVHYDYTGEFQRAWRDAVDAGILAAREHGVPDR